MLSVSITVHLNGPIIIIIISTGSSVKWKRRMSSTKKKKQKVEMPSALRSLLVRCWKVRISTICHQQQYTCSY